MRKLYKKINLKLCLLILLSSFFIFFKFPNLPKNLAFDELEFAKLALSLEHKPYTPYSTYATGHTTLYYYLILLSFKIFGINNFAFRLPSAVFGLLSVIIFWKIAKLIFKNNSFLIFASSFILLSQRWFFNFARFGFEATLLLFLETLALFFLLKFFYTKKIFWFFPASLFAGLAYNSYASGRIFPLFFILLSVYLLIKKRLQIKTFIVGIIILILLSLPLNIYFLKQPDIRAKQQIFFLDKNLNLSQKLDFFAQNLKAYALSFSFKGDTNGKHNYPLKPALNPAVAILFYLGFLLSLKNIRKFENLLFILWFFFSFAPAILTYPWENPNMLRTYTSLPAIAYFSALSLNFLKGKFKIPAFVFVIILLFSAFYEARTYFYYQAKVFDQAFEIRTPLKVFYKEGKLKIKNKE